jgi:FKBP-type peptidyl-prolyl cis-trans isomerase
MPDGHGAVGDDAYVSELESKLDALRLRLPTLEGKANKRERTACSKEIYAIENDDRYLTIVKAKADAVRTEQAKADKADSAAAVAAAKEEAKASGGSKPKRKKARAVPEGERKWVALTADGGVQKRVLCAVEGDPDESELPEEGAIVSVSYEGRYDGADGRVFETSPADRPFSFTIGDGAVLAGWDIAVRTMSQNERCGLLLSPAYAYGRDGGKGIPPNATLHFELELHEWI